MNKKDHLYQTYINILKEELIPAMGCTEPIAIAYGAAKAREVLQAVPDCVRIEASGSIIKNVKSVIVPNTQHLKGIPAAATAGIIAGHSQLELEVISQVNDQQLAAMKDFLEHTPIDVEHIDHGAVFEIIVTLWHYNDYAKVKIEGYHTNIVLIEKNGETIFTKKPDHQKSNQSADRNLLNMEAIWQFVQCLDDNDVKAILDRQIQYNMTIAEEGLKGDYGANIGKVLLKSYGDDLKIKARAYAAAGSDARMNGCELPVVINSGSGNQGITCSVPVIVYGQALQVTTHQLYQALALSNLVAIHQKTGIGRLSAYCGAVNAGVAAGAGIAFLCGGEYEDVIHTVVNGLAIVSGIICDGAKASCAGKIASAVDAGILGYEMYKNGQQFYAGDGIVTKGIEATIKNIGRLGKEGMKETNNEIIDMMIQC
ncbi:serine dehydratase subunit alpha family protein [[Clostridium] spiroforme]|nr:serine dehydratase subunit alpha family protein [Thomasclavelia spiroformis]MBM6881019.1 serine dehydratase subunit alpha family protein [Thomasclavelia spiroformis]